MDGWIPYPSTVIHSQIPSITLYVVRKHLKALKQEGLIDSDLYVDQGEERPILIRGYVVTKKGMKTSEYKLAHELERQRCKECFNLDIGSVDQLNHLFDESVLTFD
jgi:predicted ArsR family transcriptional regulator